MMFRKHLPLPSSKFVTFYRPCSLVVFRVLEDRLQVKDRPLESELTIDAFSLDCNGFMRKLRTVVDS
jgi:hypothetical protein